MRKDISIRRWQERFSNGEFDSPDFKTQVDAGWYDWFCADSSLCNKTKRLSKPILKLKNSDRINLDTMYVWFKNNCPMAHPLYDDFRIADRETGDVLYTVVYRDPYNEENHLWTAYAIREEQSIGRDGHSRFPSYKFRKTKDLVDWFNAVESE